MGIRRVTGSSPCLILVTSVERSLLKSASDARKASAFFINSLRRVALLEGEELQSVEQETLLTSLINKQAPWVAALTAP
eukprot:1151644-Pelagomonas_calceolata.AAC.2